MTKSAQALAIPFVEMANCAEHDGQQMAAICPAGMAFVRSKEGRSHRPDESSSMPNIVDGIRVLAGALHRLAY